MSDRCAPCQLQKELSRRSIVRDCIVASWITPSERTERTSGWLPPLLLASGPIAAGILVAHTVLCVCCEMGGPVHREASRRLRASSKARSAESAAQIAALVSSGPLEDGSTPAAEPRIDLLGLAKTLETRLIASLLLKDGFFHVGLRVPWYVEWASNFLQGLQHLMPGSFLTTRMAACS